MLTIDISETGPRLDELIAHLTPGEEIVIARGDRPVARLLPIVPRLRTGAELARVWPRLPHLSVADAAAWAQQIADARAAESLQPAPAWE